MINNQPDIDKIFLYAKDPHEAKYQHLIKKRINVDLNHYDDLKTFIKYSNGMQDVYKNTEEHNLEKNVNINIFYDMIADMINNKILSAVVTELFPKCRKVNSSVAFITQSYFKVPKYVRLNSRHFCVMKIPKEENFSRLQ